MTGTVADVLRFIIMDSWGFEVERCRMKVFNSLTLAVFFSSRILVMEILLELALYGMR